MITDLRKKRDMERRERTRRGVMAAAVRVFCCKGYHKTLVSDIAEEAGVGQGTFYRNFQNKLDVLNQVFDEFAAGLFESFTVFRIRPPKDADAYRQISIETVTNLAEVVAQNRDMVLFFLREGRSIDPSFTERLGDILDSLAGLARSFLEEAQSAGFARPCNPVVVSHCLVGMGLRMLEREIQRTTDPEKIRELVVEIVDFAFLGISPLNEET